MLLFFDAYLRPLLDANQVSLVKAPLFEIRAMGYADVLHAVSEDQLQRISTTLHQKGIKHSHHRYRGLASIDDAALRETCVDPNTRTAYLLQHRDAITARSFFGPGSRSS